MIKKIKRDPLGQTSSETRNISVGILTTINYVLLGSQYKLIELTTFNSNVMLKFKSARHQFTRNLSFILTLGLEHGRRAIQITYL